MGFPRFARAVLIAAAATAAVAVCARASAPASGGATSMEGLFLGLSKLGLGSVSGLEEKRQFLTTVQLEKQKIQRKMLEGIYADALEYYRRGDCARAQELAGKIAAIDPSYTDAQVLAQACTVIGPVGTAAARRALIKARMDEATALHESGRKVEAANKLEELLKLSPGDKKALEFLRQIRGEIAADYVARGQQCYQRGDMRCALNHWYNALLMDSDDGSLPPRIAWAESELRRQMADTRFKAALELYGKGKYLESYATLKTVLDYSPGDGRAQKLVAQVRDGISGTYVDEGRKFYAARLYTRAIGSWGKARDWGYDSAYVGQLIARAREQMQREEEYRREKAEKAKRDAEEAAERERKEAEEVAKQDIAGQLGENAAGVEKTGGPAGGVSEENRRASSQHFQNGLKFFQDGDYEKARNEWTLAKQLDPGSSDADAGLKRVDQMYGGGQ
ncbi:MAG: hypothetical protein WC421_07855 [Elusimicrobiales bacterium]